MNKKKLKLLVVPVAVASASVIGMVSGTLAYFTSIDKATVSIEAGQVKVSYAISTDSVATSTTFTNFTGTTAFENGGTVAVPTANSVTVSKMTPGDVVEFDVVVNNLSNVDIKYKLTASWEDTTIGVDPNGIETGKGLSEAIVVSAVLKGTTTSILTTSYVDWDYSAVAADMAKTMHVKLTFPVGEHDNAFQGAISSVAFGIDAIQQNADTSDHTYGFENSYKEAGVWHHEVASKEDFKNIFANIKGTVPGVDYSSDPSINDSSAVYLLKDDIDFGGSLWTQEELANQVPFTGTLKGEGQVTLSNAELYAGADVIRSDWNSSGIFKNALNARFENITLSNIRIDDPSAKGVGLFVAGNNPDLGATKNLEFVNCVIDDTCYIKASSNTGGFIGSTRGISNVTFTNCVNNANVECTSTNIGGFIGTGTTKASNVSNTLTFNNCVNNGDITGEYCVGGFTGNTGNASRVLTGSGNINNGKVLSIGGNANEPVCGYFFSGDSWYHSDSNFSGTNNGDIYLKKFSSYTTGPEIIVTKLTNEYGHCEDSNFKVYDENSTLLTKATYVNNVHAIDIAELTPSFDANDKLVFGNMIDADKVLVNIRQHGLRISKDKYWEYETDKYTNEMGGSQQSETYAYKHSATFNSLAAVDITKVTMGGYFIPSGANSPQASYNAGFTTYLLDSSLATNAAYTDGYHVASNGKAYIVAANASAIADQYLAICDWRNDVKYEITAYKNDVIVGTSTITWGRGAGDSTYLLPISLN